MMSDFRQIFRHLPPTAPTSAKKLPPSRARVNIFDILAEVGFSRDIRHLSAPNGARWRMSTAYGGPMEAEHQRMTFDDAQMVLGELRTPLHEARTVEQLMASTGLSASRVRRAIRWLRVPYGVRRANYADKTVIGWKLPS